MKSGLQLEIQIKKRLMCKYGMMLVRNMIVLNDRQIVHFEVFNVTVMFCQ